MDVRGWGCEGEAVPLLRKGGAGENPKGLDILSLPLGVRVCQTRCDSLSFRYIGEQCTYGMDACHWWKNKE